MNLGLTNNNATTDVTQQLAGILERIGEIKNQIGPRYSGLCDELGLSVQLKQIGGMYRVQAHQSFVVVEIWRYNSIDAWTVRKYETGAWEELVEPTFRLSQWVQAHIDDIQVYEDDFKETVQEFRRARVLRLPRESVYVGANERPFNQERAQGWIATFKRHNDELMVVLKQLRSARSWWRTLVDSSVEFLGEHWPTEHRDLIMRRFQKQVEVLRIFNESLGAAYLGGHMLRKRMITKEQLEEGILLTAHQFVDAIRAHNPQVKSRPCAFEETFARIAVNGAKGVRGP